MTPSPLAGPDRVVPASPSRRPAVVEHVDSPRSTSDGRAATPVDAHRGRLASLEFAVARSPLTRQVVTFAAIGAVSTLAWAALYLLLRLVLRPTAANAIALVVTAVGNTAANRRLTFGVRGRTGLARDQGAGLLALVLALAITTGAAAALQAIAPNTSRLAELAVLTVANAIATVARFVVLRAAIGRRPAALGS